MRRPATGAAGRSGTILRQSGTQNNMVPEVMRANSLPGKHKICFAKQKNSRIAGEIGHPYIFFANEKK